jgi:hypothetical protein
MKELRIKVLFVQSVLFINYMFNNLVFSIILNDWFKNNGIFSFLCKFLFDVINLNYGIFYFFSVFNFFFFIF